MTAERTEGSRADSLRANGTVHLEREYRATRDELWETWTDPERLARWLGTPAGPLETDRPVRLTMGDREDQWVDVRIITADRPCLLELAWDFAGESGTVLRVKFVAVAEDRTRLVLDHTGLAASATGYGAGWQAYLEGGLAHLFGAPADATWAARFAANIPVWRTRAAALA